MGDNSKLNKALWTNISRLKLMNTVAAPVRFILEKSPFPDEEEKEGTAVEQDHYCIVGRILPRSEIYKETAFRIELIVTADYPEQAPKVRFVTPVYHPNVESDGKLTLLQNE